MAFYQTNGSIPHKRHTVFNYNGKLAYEQHVSREGFSGIYSNLYHLNMPTQVIKTGDFRKDKMFTYSKEDHKPIHFTSSNQSELLLYNKGFTSFN